VRQQNRRQPAAANGEKQNLAARKKSEERRRRQLLTSGGAARHGAVKRGEIGARKRQEICGRRGAANRMENLGIAAAARENIRNACGAAKSQSAWQRQSRRRPAISGESISKAAAWRQRRKTPQSSGNGRNRKLAAKSGRSNAAISVIRQSIESGKSAENGSIELAAQW